MMFDIFSMRFNTILSRRGAEKYNIFEESSF